MNFNCDRCKTQPEEIKCALCIFTKGLMVSVGDNTLVHLFCLRWAKVEKAEEIVSVESTKECSICHKSQGLVLKCTADCEVSTHALCALGSPDIDLNYQDFTLTCKKHETTEKIERIGKSLKMRLPK